MDLKERGTENMDWFKWLRVESNDGLLWTRWWTSIQATSWLVQ